MMRRSADAVGVGQHPGVEERHRLVLGAVHHQQRPRRELRRPGRPARMLAQLSRPRVTGSRESRVRITPMSRACWSSRRGWLAQSSKSAGAPRVATPRTSRLPAPAVAHSAPPVPNPASQTPSARVAGEQVVDRGLEVGQPAAEGEVALRVAATAEAEREHDPAFAGDAVGQRRETRLPVPRAPSVPLGKPWHSTTPGAVRRDPAAPARWPCEL